MGSQALPVDRLRASLSASQVLIPGDDGYEKSLKRWSEAAEKPAAVVVQVTNANDVSKALVFAQEHHLDVAVLGGGHSTSGSSSTDGGLVVDLSKMRNVTVDHVNKTIKAEGGTIWEDVDYAAAKYDLATVGGTVNHTGVGGLTLGGGYGWLTGKYGLTIDNLLGAELVLADGRIVQASETENPDLFWAIRGAGQSFSVATSFTFRGYEQANTIYGGLLVFQSDALEKIIDFANWMVKTTEGESGMIVGIGAPPPARQVCVLATIFYNGDVAKAKDYFAPLFALKPLVDMTREMAYSDVNSLLNPVATHGDRKTQKGSAFSVPLSSSVARMLLDDYTNFISSMPDAIDSNILLEFFSQREVNKVSQTAMSFANRGEHYNILFNTRWVGAQNDTAARDWTRAMGQKVNDELKKQMIGDGVGQYGNYDGVATSLAQDIFGVNYERVLALKRHYDPKNVFNKGAGRFSW